MTMPEFLAVSRPVAGRFIAWSGDNLAEVQAFYDGTITDNGDGTLAVSDGMVDYVAEVGDWISIHGPVLKPGVPDGQDALQIVPAARLDYVFTKPA